MRKGTVGEVAAARVSELYRAGVHRDAICADVGISVDQMKRVVRRLRIERDKSLFHLGLEFIAEDGEVFVSVEGASDYYVSNLGRVVSMRCSSPGETLKPARDKDGYSTVCLTLDGGARATKRVHHLVLCAFAGPKPGDGFVCAHGNGVRSDNRESNLRWCTQAENIEDKRVHGTWQEGSLHPRSVITEAVAREIKISLSSGNTIDGTARSLAVSRHIVADISSGRTWRGA